MESAGGPKRSLLVSISTTQLFYLLHPVLSAFAGLLQPDVVSRVEDVASAGLSSYSPLNVNAKENVTQRTCYRTTIDFPHHRSHPEEYRRLWDEPLHHAGL
ncbi:hypothetical protein EYF80_052109 [Liparis tanakae]|uniref:Uncharacterized protein n=1 Tax=Liparis tanakae TaxID=230148 RepID=A0A4Z2F956_9TELE|nr:hypothetical protein EYF80_052109 [Liparis tanakae]